MTRILSVGRGDPEISLSPDPTLSDDEFDAYRLLMSHGAPLKGIPRTLFTRFGGPYDLIAASEYGIAWSLCVRLMLLRSRAKLVVVGLNQSNRLLLTGNRPLDRVLNRVWRRVSGIIVHSREEARLFQELHDIPADRFHFSHWGYDLGPADPEFQPPFARYVSMIGRNNRDIRTFIAATQRANVNGVLVTSGYMMEDVTGPIPDTVKVYCDISMPACVSVIQGSFAHLVLVQDGQRGAGHISAVTAMLMGKPQIFSSVATLDDYLIDGYNGLGVPLGDAAAVAAAIEKLQDGEVAARLGDKGRELASRWMTLAAVRRRYAAFLRAISDGQVPDLSSEWQRTRAEISGAATRA